MRGYAAYNLVSRLFFSSHNSDRDIVFCYRYRWTGPSQKGNGRLQLKSPRPRLKRFEPVKSVAQRPNETSQNSNQFKSFRT